MKEVQPYWMVWERGRNEFEILNARFFFNIEDGAMTTTQRAPPSVATGLRWLFVGMHET